MFNPSFEKLALDALQSSAAEKVVDSAAYGLMFALGVLTKNFIQRRSVAKNEIKGLSSVIVTETIYIGEHRGGSRRGKAGFSSAVLDSLRYTQIIRNPETIDLSHAYSKSHYDYIAKIIEAGMERCTTENPVVQSHCGKIIEEREKEFDPQNKTKKSFTDPILNHCQNLFRENSASYVLQTDASRKRTYKKEVRVIPVLFCEPGAAKKQLRLQLITERDLFWLSRVDERRIHCEDDIHGLGSSHMHFDRFRVLQVIARLYFDPTSNVHEMLSACAFATSSFEATASLQNEKRPRAKTLIAEARVA